MKKTGIGIAVGVAAAFLCGRASANPYRVFGFDSESTAMGGAYTALAHGVEATYFNPAGLTEGQHIEAIAGYFYGQPKINVTMTGPSATGDTFFSDVKNPPASQGYLIGLSIPPLPALKKIAGGVSIYIPNRKIYEETFGDENLPTILDYQKQTIQLMINPSLAYEIVPMVSIGVGAMLGAHIFAVNEPGNSLVGNTQGWIEGWGSPEAGILIKPLQGLKIGIAYRGEYSTHNTAHINQFGQIITLTGTTLFSPTEVAGGAAYTYERLTASVDVVYSVWQTFVPPYNEASGVGTPVTPANPNFQNTTTPRLGAQYNLTDIVSLRAGYYYKPSPAPAQTGVSNLIDNDAHVASLGIGLTIPMPKSWSDNPLKLDFHTQYQQLVERKNIKGGDAGLYNPGLPGYTVSGHALSGGATLTAIIY